MRSVIIAVVATFISFSADAQPPCTSLEALTATLKEMYGETVMDIFEPIGGGALIFFGNEESGTWTEVRISPNSPLACVVNLGMRFDRFITAPRDPAA